MSKKRELDNSDNTENSKVYIETSDGNNHPVSFQLMQSIYNEITGKKEELSKSVKTPFKVGMGDIQQLNTRFEQFKEQYNVINETSSISVLYEDDTKEVFSSFERFSLMNISNTSPIEIIIIKFNIVNIAT